MKMKNYPVSDAAVGSFILSCMKTQVACKKLVKEIDEMCEETCAICAMRVSETWTCGKCGKRVCADHIVNIGNDLDDMRLCCVDCLEEKYDKT